MRKFTGWFCFAFFLSFNLHAADLPTSEMKRTARQYKDPTIFYNLGVTYANAGETGRAILNFKKAKLLDPSDRDTAENLNRLRQSIGIPPYFSEASPIEKAVLLPFSVFSLNGSLVFGLVLFIAGSTGLSLALSRKFRLPNPGKVRTASVIIMIIGVIYITVSFIRFQFTFDGKNAVVLGNGALMERPDEQSTRLVEVAGGMECSVLEYNDGYARINTIDGHEGWLVRTNVERLWEGEK